MCPSQAQNVFTVADRDTNGTLDTSELSDMRRAILRMEPELLKHPLTPAFADKAWPPAHARHRAHRQSAEAGQLWVGHIARARYQRRRNGQPRGVAQLCHRAGAIARTSASLPQHKLCLAVSSELSWEGFPTGQAAATSERAMLELMRLLAKKINDKR